MELYLDSANISEIKDAFEQLPFITGLTTTPTFMHRHGITDIDKTIIELSKIVPVLQIEALGERSDKIVNEAYRQLDLGLDPKKTVFKIPVSLEGLKACDKLVSKGLLVNIHLIYTLQQAYMAMCSGASYICPLVGRLQDQGQDALALVKQCVDTVKTYNYNSKIMFSSVRTIEHIKNALNIGVHTCTIPWAIMSKLTSNFLTKIGTDEFFEHTKLMTLKVKDVISKQNPTIFEDKTVADSLEIMNQGGFGAVIVKSNKEEKIFTDGDLRRLIQTSGKNCLSKTLKELKLNNPISISLNDSLFDAMKVLNKNKIDVVVVKDKNEVKGILDIQDIINSQI